jgi:hypothetical protein
MIVKVCLDKTLSVKIQAVLVNSEISELKNIGMSKL